MPAVLRSVWEEPRPPGAPARVWRDWVLVGVLVPAALLEGLFAPEVPWRVVSTVLAVGLVPTLLWRRTRPLLMVVIAFGACAVAALATTGPPPGTDSMVYLLLLPYALFRWGSGREAAIGALLIPVKGGITLVSETTVPGELIGGFSVLVASMALGGAVRYRAGARARELDRVKLVERERLARDLHDTVAHHVSAIAIRAQAGLATAPSDPEAAAEALRLIENEASRTLTEMRSIVRVLRRDQPAELGPAPRIADLRDLAGTDGAAPAVDVELDGDLDDVPPSVASAVYRLAQESVTNARRHARDATRIEVHVTADESAVRLRVSDDGDTAAARPVGGAAGFGLLGMSERAGLLGGTCQAGPDPERGWTVTAVLPRTGWAA